MDEVEQHAHVVGVDLRESRVAAAVVDSDGRLVARPASIKINCTRSPRQVLESAVAGLIDEAIKSSGRRASAVGLALPGTLRPEEGLCLLSTPLGWEDVPVRDIIQASSGLPTVLVNDVRAMILGEMHYGGAVGIDNFAYASLGSTIVGGLVIGGRIYEGASDCAGEIGHVTVDHDGLSCTCGNQGCLETMASGPAVARMAAESLKLGAQSVLSEWVSDETPITAELVYRAAREGDALAARIWEKVGRYLGLGFASVITIANPQRIVIGGKVAQAFEYFAPTMQEEIRRRARMVPRDYTQLLPSPLGLDAPLLGSAWCALRAIAAPGETASTGIN